MFNTKEFGNRLAEKRREAGLTQEELVARVGDENMSLSTLKRLEGGCGHIEMVRMLKICKALGCMLQDLIEENVVQKALERYFCDPGKEEETSEYMYRQRLFYPESYESIYYQSQPIKTLLPFLIYLPLMDPVQVMEALRKIEGDVFGNEPYVLDKLRDVFRQIPESNAKRYADYCAEKCTYEHFMDYYTSTITDAERIWLDPDRSVEMLAWHDEYLKLIEKKIAEAKAIKTLKE